MVRLKIIKTEMLMLIKKSYQMKHGTRHICFYKLIRNY